MTTHAPIMEQTNVATLSPPKMTFEEFLAWADEDTWAEWVNGEVIIMSPATGRHQDISKFFTLLLEAYLSEHPVARLWYAPFLMRLPMKSSGREPDIIVLLNEHLDRFKETYLDGPADLVIEVISKESQTRDRGDKYAEYEESGVTEYWLIDPLRDHADFYRLGENERYNRIDLDTEGRFHSAVLPGLYVDPTWLWKDRLPNFTQTGELVQQMLA